MPIFGLGTTGKIRFDSYKMVAIFPGMSTNLSKAEAFARVITGKAVTVTAGRKSEPPHTDGRKITLGKAIDWDIEDTFGVLFHETCHIQFPAEYPTGALRQLANLIDDCRIERQAIAVRPHYADSLATVVTNVIANGFYENPPKDRLSPEGFDPCYWALLFFRPHVGEDCRLAASECVTAYAAAKGLDKQEGWAEKFDTLVKDGQRITRLKTVSKATLEAWCKLYFETFPDAEKDANGELAVAVLNDAPAPKGDQKQDQDGEGSKAEDNAIRIKVTGQGKPSDGEGEDGDQDEGEGEDGDQEPKESKGSKDGQDKQEKPGKAPGKPNKGLNGSEEAETPSNLEEALESLKKAVGEVGDKTKQAAEATGEAGNHLGETTEIPEEVDEELGGEAPGTGIVNIGSAKTSHAVDMNFVQKTKSCIRKLRSISIDRVEQFRKTGHLHLPTVIHAERRGILPRKPFIRSTDDIIDAPIACVVATDFSGSTEGHANPFLNAFSHNSLYALQEAGCECAEVVWNSGSWITKSIDQRVSPVQSHFHKSDGGTCLIAATKGCIESLKRAKAQRKIAFIFTDGGVNTSEIAMVDQHLRKNGFEACLLVSIGQEVPHKGIVSTVVCKSITELAGIFNRFVRQQMIKTVEAM